MITNDLHTMYEHAIQNITKYSKSEQNAISDNLITLTWIDKLLDSKRDTAQLTINDLALCIEDKIEDVVDIMALSAFVYKGKERGLNVEKLKNAINNNRDWLVKKQLEIVFH